MLKKYCYVNGAIKIESIFCGSKISLQVKLYEARVQLMNTGIKSLLPRPTGLRALAPVKADDPLGNDDNDEIKTVEADVLNDDLSDGSIINNSDEEDTSLKPTLPPKTVPKRTVRKVVKKKLSSK